MNRARVSIISVSLAFLVAACGSSQTPSQTSDQGTGGSNGSPTGNGGGGTTKTGKGGAATTTKTGSGGKTTSSSSKATSNGGGSEADTSDSSQGGASDGGEGGTESGGASEGAKSGTATKSTGTGGKSATPASSGGTSAGSSKGGADAGGTSAGSQGGAATGGTKASATTAAVVDEPKLVTSVEGAYWKVGTPTEVTSGNANVTVSDTAKQNWDGFGGTFNEKGWYYLQMLTEAERAAALKLLFDAADGANFTYGRIPIGASDYAMERYTLCDTKDETMAAFSIEKDKKYLIPYIKAALDIKPNLHLWGSPWTPPPWMKDNNAYDKGGMKDASFPAFALYLAKFVEEYGKEGMTIEAVHPQNEPGYFDNPYPCCKWTANQMKTFIGAHLGPVFAERSITAEIWAGTMSAPEDGSAILPAILGDTNAMKYVKGVGLQWNTSGAVSTARNKGLPVMQTEHKCGNYNWLTPYDANKAPNDFAYGVESWTNIKDWINAGVNSYSAWNMVLDNVGKNMNTEKPWPQNALLIIDTGSKKLTATPAYHVFRHLSQYVDPGAKVVGTSGGDALAFKNPDGTVVAVLYNSGGAGKQIVSIGGKKLQFDMPGKGWATINWKN